ncbi:nucleoid-associated protein [Sulfurovum sp.]|uniref:nucleoid-associated protein n=1 Tax=Sulfurovum sp. TaxID=1969726 RepID=UPI0028680899|nr:nucleoid-associated protein [Sulfurovum sp.]
MPPVQIAEFANFQIEKMMIHEIFKLDNARQVVPPRLNEEITVLDQDGLRVLGDRIVAAIGMDSKSVEMDISERDEGSVYFHVDTIFNEYEDDLVFIERSKEITRKLARSQHSRNLPGGVVVVLKGSTGFELSKFLLVIKAEWQDGFRKSGENAMSYVNDILLTPQQRMYKIGAFVRRENATKVFVYDHNMSKTEEQGMALYFYSAFLGCDMLHTNKYFTTKFYNGTKAYINNSALGDEEKYDLNTYLYSYMKSDAQTTISITDFADRYITQPTKRDEYSLHMRTEVFRDENFNRSIQKDIADIRTKLKMRKVYFSGNIKIFGPSEGFDDKVTIQNREQDDNGAIVSTTVRILGHIEGMDR